MADQFDALAGVREPSVASGIGLALQGFGAGVQGQLPQFQQSLQNRAERRQTLGLERKQAFAQDLLGTKNLIDAGDLQGGANLLSGRIEMITQLGGDPSDTIELLQSIQSAQTPEELQAISGELGTLVNRSIQAGFLEAPAAQQFISGGDVSNEGQVFVQTGAGPVAQDVVGFKAKDTTKDIDPQKQINVLRGDVKDIGKSFRLVEESFNRIKKVGGKGTAASDMSLIFNFMKMLDPGSTVREGEFASAEAATGVPGRVVNLYNRALEGTRLGPAQRKDFIDQATGLFGAQQDATDSQIENILQQADQDSIGRVKVLGKSRLSKFDKRAAERAPSTSGFKILSVE